MNSWRRGSSWFGGMFEMGTDAWAIAARSALAYLAVYAGLRLARR